MTAIVRNKKPKRYPEPDVPFRREDLVQHISGKVVRWREIYWDEENGHWGSYEITGHASHTNNYKVNIEDFTLFVPSPELEQAFNEAIDKYQGEIREAIRLAEVCIERAKEISEKAGIPFEGIAPIYQTYIPESMNKGLPPAVIEKLSGVLIEDPAYMRTGWEHSDIC